MDHSNQTDTVSARPWAESESRQTWVENVHLLNGTDRLALPLAVIFVLPLADFWK
jgi:hypothetical protein